MRLVASLALALVAGAASAAPEAQIWQRWTQHAQDSISTIDHSAWTRWLQQYVVTGGPGDLNRLRYGAVSSADEQALRAYIDKLETIEISNYARPEQRAFWTNLYNAIVVNLVLKHYPIQSIQDIDNGFFGNGPWDEKRVTVEGTALSLRDIEYRILRPIWDDGLNSYGLNKAAVSSPNLLPQAYTGANMHRLLRENARAYVNSRRGVRFNAANKLTISPIYKWHKQAYGGIEAGIITHLRTFAEPALSLHLDAANGIDNYASYNWALNAQRNVD